MHDQVSIIIPHVHVARFSSLCNLSGMNLSSMSFPFHNITAKPHVHVNWLWYVMAILGYSMTSFVFQYLLHDKHESMWK